MDLISQTNTSCKAFMATHTHTVSLVGFSEGELSKAPFLFYHFIYWSLFYPFFSLSRAVGLSLPRNRIDYKPVEVGPKVSFTAQGFVHCSTVAYTAEGWRVGCSQGWGSLGTSRFNYDSEGHKSMTKWLTMRLSNAFTCKKLHSSATTTLLAVYQELKLNLP